MVILCEQGGMLPWLRPHVLRRRFNLSTKLCGCVPWPAWVIEDPAGERDEIGISGAHDGFGLLEGSDESDRYYWDTDCTLHCPRKRNLVAWPNGDLLPGIQASA
jgi:hypothetical protein